MTADGLRNRHLGEPALILGNGESRKHVDPVKVIAAGDAWVIGCNAIIRDVPEVDYACACDLGPVQEWQRLKRIGPTYVTLQPDPRFQFAAPLICWRPPIRWPDRMLFTGQYAILLAMWMGCDPVYLAGFDFGDGNVYRGQYLYPRGYPDRAVPDDLRTLTASYIDQMEKIVAYRPIFYQFPPKTFWFTIEEEVPSDWR